MKKLFFLFLLISVYGCSSTLHLKLSNQMTYDRYGLGAESPWEVANAAATLTYAEMMREAVQKDPKNALYFTYLGYGGYGYGYTDPCYYYPPGECSVAQPVAQEEVKKVGKEQNADTSQQGTGGEK